MRVAAALALFQVVAMLSQPVQKALFMSGIVASLCSVGSALSTLATLPVVFRTQRSDSIPGAIVLAGLSSAVIWFLCGMLLADPCILIPNGFAICTSAYCLYLKAKYPSTDVQKEHRSSTKAGMEKRLDIEECKVPCAEEEHEMPTELTPLPLDGCSGGTF